MSQQTRTRVRSFSCVRAPVRVMAQRRQKKKKNRSVVQEAQVLALLQTISSVVLYNTQFVVRWPDVEALLM